MHSEHPEIDDLVDQFADAIEELILICDEGDKQANGKPSAQDLQDPEPYDEDCENTKQHFVSGPENQRQLIRGQLPIHRLHREIQPVDTPVVLRVETA